MHKLLDRHEDRHDERKRHCNRHSGGHDDDVKGKVVPLLPSKEGVHIFDQHVHLDDEGKEEDGHQGKAERLCDRVVDIALEGRRDGGEQHADEREDEGDQQLQNGAGRDEDAEAHEEEPAARSRAAR